jgi:hypothetical protein
MSSYLSAYNTNYVEFENLEDIYLACKYSDNNSKISFSIENYSIKPHQPNFKPLQLPKVPIDLYDARKLEDFIIHKYKFENTAYAEEFAQMLKTGLISKFGIDTFVSILTTIIDEFQKPRIGFWDNKSTYITFNHSRGKYDIINKSEIKFILINGNNTNLPDKFFKISSLQNFIEKEYTITDEPKSIFENWRQEFLKNFPESYESQFSYEFFMYNLNQILKKFY